jgi:hypothetical protein
MTAGFGDFDPGPDSHDDAPPDPEAVARILWALLKASMPDRFEDFDHHRPDVRAKIVAAVRTLLDRLRDEGPA